jgi:hypothetical protein
MEPRKKAQDVFNDTNFIFSQKTTFEKAFPEIEKISVEVNESGEGVYRGYGLSHYGKHNIGEFINCKNPKCYNEDSTSEILFEVYISGKIRKQQEVHTVKERKELQREEELMEIVKMILSILSKLNINHQKVLMI